jgi:hypothetical protein
MKLLFPLIYIFILSVKATCPTFGSAEQYGVLGSSTVTNTGNTTVAGSVGVSPGTAIVGFPPGQVTGSLDTGAVSGQASALTLFNELLQMPCTNLTNDLGGLTVLAGVYCVSAAQLTSTLTLDGAGSSTGIWVFNVGSTLTGAASTSIDLVNGSLPCNVFWTVGSSATFGGGSFVGTVIAAQSITMTTGSILTGHAFALNAAVTMDTNEIISCYCDGVAQPLSPQMEQPTGVPTNIGGPQPSTPNSSSPQSVTPQAVSSPVLSPSRPPTLRTSGGGLAVPITLLGAFITALF